MKLSYNWLKSFLPDFNMSPAEVAELLTLHSFEAALADELIIDPQVTVAEITNLEAHPKADRLRLATVDTGDNEITVVCGASNIEIGDIVPYAPPGARLRDENGILQQLKTALIRGVSSPGMLTSPRELGLGQEHGGIYILPSDTPRGKKLVEYLPSDVILDADITPNRAGDCLSHLGIAREIAALLDLSIIEPTIPDLSDDKLPPNWSVDLAETADVLRYMGTSLTNVVIKPSPLWLQARLWAVGAKPINNLVDITNYVLYERGTPSHAFDAAKLVSKKVGVRRARVDESLTTLDETTYKLTQDDLIITDDDQPVALAGIMGGRSSQVSQQTTTVWLEVANFSSYLIQETSRRLKATSDSAGRHMKDSSPELLPDATARIAELMMDLAEAKFEGKIDYYPRPVKQVKIDFDSKRVTRLAGVDIAEPDVSRALINLRCKVNVNKGESDIWEVRPPADRLDLTGEHDLIEEVIRFNGLANILAKKPQVDKPVVLPEVVQWRELVRDYLVERGGIDMLNYSFEDDTVWSLLDRTSPEDSITVANPPAPEQRHLRQTLLPRLLLSTVANKGQLKRRTSRPKHLLFEVGVVFMPDEKGRVAGIREDYHVALVLLGERASQAEVNGLIDDLLAKFGVEREQAREIIAVSELRGTPLATKLGLPIKGVEINLTKLIEATELSPAFSLTTEVEAKQYVVPSKFPVVTRDLSILVETNTSVEQVQSIIERAGRELVVDVDLFDVYEKEEKKSLAWHIHYQSDDHTLTDDEVSKLHNEIVTMLQSELGARLR